jgi:hypothetical protein
MQDGETGFVGGEAFLEPAGEQMGVSRLVEQPVIALRQGEAAIERGGRAVQVAGEA